MIYEDDLVNPRIITRPEFSNQKMYANTFSIGGLTTRQYFAAMAMQGLLANPELTDAIAKMIQSSKYNLPTQPKQVIADMAVQSADALIEQLNIQT